jgi:hypothetical protein
MPKEISKWPRHNDLPARKRHKANVRRSWPCASDTAVRPFRKIVSSFALTVGTGSLFIAASCMAQNHVLRGQGKAGDWQSDAPGVEHRISISDLPSDYATPGHGTIWEITRIRVIRTPAPTWRVRSSYPTFWCRHIRLRSI